MKHQFQLLLDEWVCARIFIITLRCERAIYQCIREWRTKKKREFHQFSLIAPMTTIQCYKLSTNQMIVENFEYQPPSGSHHDTTATPVIFPSLSPLTTPLVKGKKLLLSTVRDDAQKKGRKMFMKHQQHLKLLIFPPHLCDLIFFLFLSQVTQLSFLPFIHSFIFIHFHNTKKPPSFMTRCSYMRLAVSIATKEV